jgi:hypothetical protein
MHSSDHGRRPLLLRDIKIKFMETPAVPSATHSMATRRPEISTAASLMRAWCRRDGCTATFQMAATNLMAAHWDTVWGFFFFFLMICISGLMLVPSPSCELYSQYPN